ncbi:chloride channel CLIC-like protein 1 [Limulus polyphemus]|uniref:Chloride channel CLIC-like protein 1 n=1 Tax=Limulus polyphemus TaxID=6850 RepID=A0ABM1BYT3_LIMPO|nr:chloride channel CLIC-like protein 1 [Limulus polyphemus]
MFRALIITCIVIVKIVCSNGNNHKQDESVTTINSNTNSDGDDKTEREFTGRAKTPSKEDVYKWFGTTDQVKNGWVDPHAMFDYDHNTINHDRINKIKRNTDETKFQDDDFQMNNKGGVKLNEDRAKINCDVELYNCHNLQNDLNNCKKSLLENTQEFCKCEHVYLRRLVKKFVYKLKPFDLKLKNSTDIQISLSLSPKDIEAFDLFVAYPGKYINELDQTLSELISNSIVSEQYVIKESWLESLHRNIWLSEFTIPVLFFFGLVLLKVNFVYKSWFQVILRLLAIIFIFSFGIEWINLYKIQLAKKHASLSSGSVPQECSPDDMDWWQSIKTWFKSGVMVEENLCEKYYKSIMVDPFWEVTPLMALSETIWKFVLHPAALLGTYVGRFIKMLFLEIPPFLWLPAALFIFIIFCLIIVMCFGYRVRFPFFLGTLEPAYRNTEALNLPTMVLNTLRVETFTPNDPSVSSLEAEDMVRSEKNNIKDCIKGKDSEYKKVSKKWSGINTRKAYRTTSVPHNMLGIKSGTSKNINKRKLMSKSLSDSNLAEMNNASAIAAKNYSCILKSFYIPSISDEGFNSKPNEKKQVSTRNTFSAGDMENER